MKRADILAQNEEYIENSLNKIKRQKEFYYNKLENINSKQLKKINIQMKKNSDEFF